MQGSVSGFRKFKKPFHATFIPFNSGKNTTVKNCLFGDFARIGDNCRLEGCVFGPKAVVGSGVELNGVCLLPVGSKVLSTDDPSHFPSVHNYGLVSAGGSQRGRAEGSGVTGAGQVDARDSGEESDDSETAFVVGVGAVRPTAEDVIYQVGGAKVCVYTKQSSELRETQLTSSRK